MTQGRIRRVSRSHRVTSVLAIGILVLSALVALPHVPALSVTEQAGFNETVVIDGLSAPTSVAFAPDGRVFVAEKSGIVKVYDSLADPTAAVFADLRTGTHDFWDRGLLGLTVDPGFPERPYVYVAYTYDAEPGGTAPRWGDECPNPPGATDEGCVVTGQVSKLVMGGSGVAVDEQVLLNGWCQQYPSHSIGTVTFGPDGALYVGGGDGASFNFTDYGQVNNPCGDPPESAGTDLSAPEAQGGALRSQSVRRPDGQPAVLNGSILRIDPDTGRAMPGNPFASSADPAERKTIAYGMRNPFRFAFRPDTAELWIGDVGWSNWEEINVIPDATDGAAENFGWPCYEGSARQSGYDGANLTSCETLYTGTGQQEPYAAYNHDAKVVAGGPCATGGSSISGLAFESGSNYPDAYQGALFFADSSRNCIWAMSPSSGTPDPSRITPFVTNADIPVQLLTGPGGDLYYVALGAGEVRRVTYWDGTNRAPHAVATASPDSGPAPLTVQFDGARSNDPDPGDSVSYAWDLDGDGAYDDSAEARPVYTYTEVARVAVGLKVTDTSSASATATVPVTVGDPVGPDPVPVIDTPTEELRWQAGQRITFSGRAVDSQDGELDPSAFRWKLDLRHCADNDTCHTHTVRELARISSGAFTAPDHGYPSHLKLTLNVTDSAGNTGSTAVRLDPRTVQLRFTSNPSELTLVVGGQDEQTPFTRTVIVGSKNSISAPSPQYVPSLLFPMKYGFSSWSDGGARTHNITAPADPTEYRATYRRCWVLNPC